MSKILLYTVVRHSGYDTGHHEFARGLESARVTTAAGVAAVQKAGGRLFEKCDEAEDFAMEEQYRDAPPMSLIPSAPGTFDAVAKIDGRPVYVPRPTEESN